jgi:hypothetical protein
LLCLMQLHRCLKILPLAQFELGPSQRVSQRVSMAEAAPSAVSAAEQALNVASYSINSGKPVFSHLYASPLVQETLNAQGGKELKPVDELKYGEERSALLDVLRLAGRAVKFKSEVSYF